MYTTRNYSIVVLYYLYCPPFLDLIIYLYITKSEPERHKPSASISDSLVAGKLEKLTYLVICDKQINFTSFHWSRDPEVAGWIPSWRPCNFHNLCRLSPIMYIFQTIEFATPYFDIHLMTTSVSAKYYFQVLRCLFFMLFPSKFWNVPHDCHSGVFNCFYAAQFLFMTGWNMLQNVFCTLVIKLHISRWRSSIILVRLYLLDFILIRSAAFRCFQVLV